MSADHHTLEQIAAVASKVTYGAAGATGVTSVATYLGFTRDEWSVIGILIGIVVSVTGLAFNFWFNLTYRRK